MILKGSLRKTDMERRWTPMSGLCAFFAEEDAIGVVEIILILVVLIGLVMIFKKQLVDLVENILEKITEQSKEI